MAINSTLKVEPALIRMLCTNIILKHLKIPVWKLVLNLICTCIILVLYIIEETRQYKTIANNITQFDKGPRIIHHPPSNARSLGGDLGLNVSWRCDAFAKGEVSYQWLKNNQVHVMHQRIDNKV